MALKIGDKAPAFELRDTQKNKVSLSAYEGKNVLLVFFPLAFTSVCTKELCGIRDNIGSYNSVDAQVFGISVDSPQTLAKFKEEQQLNFPLLSDFNREASTAYESIYEVFGDWMRGVSKRSAFIIDKNGIIRYAEVLENAGDVPDFEAILSTLKGLN